MTLQWLWAIPILHFFGMLYIALWRKRLDAITTNYAVMYLDWLFIPFNLAVAHTVTFHLGTALMLATGSVAIIIFIHLGWHRRAEKKKTDFHIKTWNRAQQLIHGAFMLVQFVLAGLFLLTSGKGGWYLIGLYSLLAYALSYVLIVKFVRKQRMLSKPELPFFFVLFAILLIKIGYAYV